VQTLFPLDGGYAVKLTTAKWYTPVGRTIQKERKLTDAGEYVEVYPDSLPPDSLRKIRPAYKSDGGRTVYGGGAITPDLIVQPDTLTTPEQTLARTLAPKGATFYSVLQKYAYDLKPSVRPEFTVQPAWRNELYRRLRQAEVTVDSSTWVAGSAYVDRLLENEVARRAFGDSTLTRRGLRDDPQLRRAIEVLQKGQSQRDLFALVPAPASSRQ
jgi:carboxyl-terminal processing protease